MNLAVHFCLKKGAPAQEKYGGIEDFALMSAQRFITAKPHYMHLQ
jgi:hypothetical protein